MQTVTAREWWDLGLRKSWEAYAFQAMTLQEKDEPIQ